MKAIINGLILKDDILIENSVLLFDDKIIDIVDKEQYKTYKNDVSDEFDAKGNYVLAGFIDQHIHGYGGYDVMDNSEQSILEIKKSLVKNGVTSFLPTTLTAPKETLNSVCDKVRKLKNQHSSGAKIIGIHLEGPFINESKKGAQNEKYIVSPDYDFVKENKDILKIVTLAPEIEGNLKLIETFKDDINFQIGHTNATFDEAQKGLDAGAKGFTHTFNAMTGIHHRDLGAVGCCLMDDKAYAELICDNIHLDKNVYNFVIKNKGIEKILLISDCISAGGLTDGKYSLGGLSVNLKDGACTLENGVLAGSVLKLNVALKNIVQNSNETFINCIKMVTVNQAKYLGLDKEIGKLSKGFSSDIVIMDKNYDVQMTFVEGRCEYEVQL